MHSAIRKFVNINLKVFRGIELRFTAVLRSTAVMQFSKKYYPNEQKTPKVLLNKKNELIEEDLSNSKKLSLGFSLGIATKCGVQNHYATTSRE